MIDIEITRNPMRIHCTGHATGAGDPGENLVCCAVTTLIYTLDEALYAESINCTDEIEGGYADIILLPRPAKSQDAETIFRTICTGLKCLAEQYPDFISFRKEYDD